MEYTTYSHNEIHSRLCDRLLSEEERTTGVDPQHQALFCPFYVKLEGTLGADWGAIVNPASPKFGTVVFEHDACDCPDHPPACGLQTTDEWLAPAHSYRPEPSP